MINKIERFAGDTYPEKVTIRLNGQLLDLSGKTVKLRFTDGAKTVESTGNVTGLGEVEFPFDHDDVSTAGRFKYSIKIDDGQYIRTYAVDDFIILDNV